jgi:hypothetical protein
MNESHEVVLDIATPRDAAVLANLLELYAHDLSEAFVGFALITRGSWAGGCLK